MSQVAKGTFEVRLTPAEAELGGAVPRMELEKTFDGDVEGTARGVMLSCGDPSMGGGLRRDRGRQRHPRWAIRESGLLENSSGF